MSSKCGPVLHRWDRSGRTSCEYAWLGWRRLERQDQGKRVSIAETLRMGGCVLTSKIYERPAHSGRNSYRYLYVTLVLLCDRSSLNPCGGWVNVQVDSSILGSLIVTNRSAESLRRSAPSAFQFVEVLGKLIRTLRKAAGITIRPNQPDAVGAKRRAQPRFEKIRKPRD
jgi:hypothetical protein